MKYKNEDLSKLLGKALSKFKTVKLHGSRDYYQIKGKIPFEIVPVLDIKKAEQAQNVTDFSPWHVKWVINNSKKYQDDIMLAKKFMKAQKVYGAESYIKGFSGHVIDILVIHYKGFIPMLKASAKWKDKQVIDNKKSKNVFMKLNKSKLQSPIIVIDPVQPDRNAAAALNEEKFNIFLKAAKGFLKKPLKKYFIEQETDFKKLSKRGTLIRLNITSLRGKKDVIGSKLLKAFTFMKDGLNDFKILNSGWTWDKKSKTEFWYLLKIDKLEKTFEKSGPQISRIDSVKDFKKKHKKIFKKGNKVWANIKRKNTTPVPAVKELAKNEYFKTRVKTWQMK